MKQLRYGTFETNSSSSHSLVITKAAPKHYTPEEAYRELFVDSEGYWNPCDELYFGRSPFKVLATFADKLKYAYANSPLRKVKHKKGGFNYYKEYYKVTNIVKKFLGQDKQFNGIEKWYLKHYTVGTDDYALRHWLKTSKMSLIEFLTNKSVIIICDGDEYCIWETMKESGLININNIKTELE